MSAELASELKIRLAVTRERLMAAIAGVSEQQFKKRPAATGEEPEPWCIAELLAHILDFNQLWMARIAQALDHPESAVTPSDDAIHQAATRAGRLAPVPQLVHGLVAARRGLDQLIDRAVAGDGLNQAVVHPTRGRLTVEWMVQTYGINHEREHAEQIERLREAVGATTSSPAAASPSPSNLRPSSEQAPRGVTDETSQADGLPSV